MNKRVYSVTSEPTQNSSRRVSSFKYFFFVCGQSPPAAKIPLGGLISASEILSGELLISEVLPIASTLLVVKTENIYRNIRKMLLAIKLCTGGHHRCYMFTSEPTQSSSRRVSSFKDSSALLNN